MKSLTPSLIVIQCIYILFIDIFLQKGAVIVFVKEQIQPTLEHAGS